MNEPTMKPCAIDLLIIYVVTITCEGPLLSTTYVSGGHKTLPKPFLTWFLAAPFQYVFVRVVVR
jgi:hypothetical protein